MTAPASYTDYLKSCQSYNKRISAERRHRLPFLDAQTGIAQFPSFLWRDKNERRLSTDSYVAFIYPASQRWRRRKSNFNIYSTDVRWATKSEPMDSSETIGGGGEGDIGNSNLPGTPAIGIVNSAKSGGISAGPNSDIQLNVSYTRSGGDGGGNSDTKGSQDQTWYDDMSDPQVDDYEDPSDGDDYEETYVKKKPKKKKSGTGTGERKVRRPNDIPDSEKPFMCKHCGAKYKTKPGLHYHLTHAHINEFNEQKERQQSEQAAAASAVNTRNTSPAAGSQAVSSGGFTQFDSIAPVENVDRGGIRPLGKLKGEPNNYCDFCLGTASDNKKTNTQEELIHCSDCGRSGHPSCLNFTANMVISTKKYGWQCIECKSCAMCGTSENDDQLLFCDDCDRGFHMYCLRPPLAAPPEGNWSCHLCVVEFGTNASRPAEPSNTALIITDQN